MKKSIWQDADIYGQVLVWALSVFPFIYAFSSLFVASELYIVLLVHGLGLLILGVWQMVSSLVNLLYAEQKEQKFFRNNVFTGLGLGLLFFFWAYTDHFKVPLPLTKEYYNYVLSGYFLVIDIAAIRYWLYIRKYYKQLNNG